MSAVQPIRPLKRKPAREATAGEAELARKCLHYMSMMRQVEDRIERKLYRQGKILGGVYVGRGQEAIPVGTGLVAEADDVLFPSHRDMAVYLIRGVPVRRIFAQYMGRTGGLTRGRDGNMHMGSLDLKIVPIISAMAASVPVATGAAMAMQYLGKPNVAFCYFGDGATSRGDWHEGLNLASVRKAPVVFVCNNNQYAYSTPVADQMACANVADRGVPPTACSGRDRWTVTTCFAVHHAAQRGAPWTAPAPVKGPSLIECKHLPHDRTLRPRSGRLRAVQTPVGGMGASSTRSSPPGSRRCWSAAGPHRPTVDRDPRLHRAAEADEAVAWAEQSPFPDKSTLLEGVYEADQ